MKYLDKIKSPADVKNLNEDDLPLLAQEIREVLVDTVSQNGGHLASNLGVVELTIALHRVFDSPKDKIIWDVGHQAYTHKLLTGRYPELRQYAVRADFRALQIRRRASTIFFTADTRVLLFQRLSVLQPQTVLIMISIPQ